MATPPGRTRSVVSVAMLAALSLLLVPPGVAAARPAAPPSTDELRIHMLALVNRSRAAHGLPTLHVDRHLSKEALRHSRSMAHDGGISHTPNLSELIGDEGGSVFGEDVARGRGLQGIRDAWLRRADTQRVLLDPRFHLVGLGVVHLGGFFWVTLQAFD